MDEDVLDRDEKMPGSGAGVDFRDKEGLTRDQKHARVNPPDVTVDLTPPYDTDAAPKGEPVS